MRELYIVERFGQVTVSTSDGRKATSISVGGAMTKAGLDANVAEAFASIRERPDGGQIHQGQESG